MFHTWKIQDLKIETLWLSQLGSLVTCCFSVSDFFQTIRQIGGIAVPAGFSLGTYCLLALVSFLVRGELPWSSSNF